jgi:hypothetical protein
VLQDGRDMFWSIVPLVVACIALAGLVGMCSFSPSGPSSGPTPSFDAAAALQADAATLGIPVRSPQLPAGWRSNSGRRASIDPGRTDPASRQQVRALTSTVGYLTPSGMYLSLTQSNADEEKLVGFLGSSLYPTGSHDVNGVNWVVYEGGERGEPVWTTRLDGPTGPGQIAITGAGNTDEFSTLASATQSQPPLPASR